MIYDIIVIVGVVVILGTIVGVLWLRVACNSSSFVSYPGNYFFPLLSPPPVIQFGPNSPQYGGTHA
jgi:hypothetical protein